MEEVRLIDANALKKKIQGVVENEMPIDKRWALGLGYSLKLIDNATTIEPNSEYGAIQYSNGFNDGFTLAKDTIIQNIAKQYSAHNELVPGWLSIGDMRGKEE